MKNIFAAFLVLISFQLRAQTSANESTARQVIEGLEIVNTGPGATCDKNINEAKLQDSQGKSFPVTVMSLEYLNEIFKIIAANPQIPFKYPEDGCHARAHEMSRILEKYGVISAKVFIEGDLKVLTKNSPKGYVEWWYHVAPVVKVKQGNKEVIYVIDPSIFDKPVPVEEWFNIQTSHKKTAAEFKTTYFNERYHYWPYDKDQKMSDYDANHLDNARDTMAQYLIIQNERQKDKK